MSGVVQFPPIEARTDDLLVGPFQQWRVVVEGRFVPGLTGRPASDGKITLVVDERFAAEFDAATAGTVAWLIAHASAVASGYTHLGAESRERPFAPKSIGPAQ